jgi:uncharacterized protein
MNNWARGSLASIFARVLTFVCLVLTTAYASTGRLPPPELVDAEPPYWVEAVRVQSGDVTLAGTLLTPATGQAAPAVIIVPGSGPTPRSGPWNMYRSIGEYLVQRDIAVLLYDKRGVGESTGNWKVETFDERAQDVAALVGFFKSRAEISPAQIGLVGHSQGAYIAPLVVAGHSPDIAFVVLLAGSGQTVWNQVLTNARAEALASGTAEAEADLQVDELEGQLGLARRFGAPCRVLRVNYLCFVLDYDPRAALENLTVPALALYAELDTQVPPDVNIPMLEEALKTAGNADYAIYTFESANHWFAEADNGTTAEMRELTQHGAIDHFEFVPDFLETLGDWVAAQAATGGSNVAPPTGQ